MNLIENNEILFIANNIKKQIKSKYGEYYQDITINNDKYFIHYSVKNEQIDGHCRVNLRYSNQNGSFMRLKYRLEFDHGALNGTQVIMNEKEDSLYRSYWNDNKITKVLYYRK